MESGEVPKKEVEAEEWPWMKNPVGTTEIMMKDTVDEIHRRRNGFRDFPQAPTPPPTPTELAVPKRPRRPAHKTPPHLEDFFKILERTMDHPVVKPDFHYSTYLEHVTAFGRTELRKYDLFHSAPALRSATRPKLDIARSFPSTAARIAAECEEEAKGEAYSHLTKQSHLVTCPQACNCVTQHFQLILLCLKKCESRAKKIIEGGGAEHDYGLGQLGGFCAEVNAFTQMAVLGTKVFTHTASSGLVNVLDLLKNPKALLNLRKVSASLLSELPTEDDCLQARIKIRASLDTIFDSYHKIGRPGFNGNWTAFQNCDPEVIESADMDQIFMSLINGFAKLSAVTADLIEVYRSFIYSDNVEKTYLIKYIRTFPPGDQVKVMNNLEVLNGRIREVHQVLAQLDLITQRLAKLYAPPERIPMGNLGCRRK